MIAQQQPTTAVKILVVDDEWNVCDILQTILEGEGYAVRTAADGQEGLRSFFTWQPSMVILDVMMPKMDGWSLMERIREVSDVPIIMLTARGQEPDKVRGLRAGADDYLVKPVPMGELTARVDAIFRRVKETPGGAKIYKDAALHVDFSRHQVHLQGKPVALSPQEFRMLAAFVERPGLVLSTDHLLELCWAEGEGGPESVRVYIGYLRKKLEDDPRQPQLIETVREFGYRYRPQA